MKNISRNSKILSISHNDWDGTFSQIILGNVFSDIYYLNTSFYKIDDVMESIEYKNYDFVFLTDINPTNHKLLDISDNIILLDHHESAIEANNPSKMHYVITNQCASKLTLRFVEKYFKIKLPHLYNHCEMVNDYDMWILKDPNSKKMNDLMFYYYKPRKFRELFFNGRTIFTEEEEKWLEIRNEEFKRRYESLTVFECENINGCIVQSEEFINEICDKLMKEEGYDIVFCRNPIHGRVSIRHKIDGFNIGQTLRKLGFGGGHCNSAGAFISDMDDFKKKIELLEKIVAKHIDNYNKEENMPYIEQSQRTKFDIYLNKIDKIENKGELEYCIFKLMKKYMEGKEFRYTTLHDCTYAAMHCADEFRRRFLDKREDEAMNQNGDII